MQRIPFETFFIFSAGKPAYKKQNLYTFIIIIIIIIIVIAH
jgi:hypothetical protein